MRLLHGNLSYMQGIPYVYLIICHASGWFYVGATNNMRRRFREHESQERNPQLKADYERFGWRNFTLIPFERLERNPEETLRARLLEREAFWYQHLIEDPKTYSMRRPAHFRAGVTYYEADDIYNDPDPWGTFDP